MTRYAMPQELADRIRQDAGRIVLTGSGGWLGLATIDLLRGIFSPDELRDRLICLGASRRTLSLLDSTRIEQLPLTAIDGLGKQNSTVLHTAFLTKDRATVLTEDAYRAANGEISNRVHDALESIGCERLFVASSGAAGRSRDEGAAPDLRLYGELKRRDEERFAGWAHSHGRRATIVRIFSLSGGYINKPAAYALAGFILDALAGRPIEVRAAHSVFRSYVAVQELIALVFADMLGGSGVTQFDSGGKPMEMLDIATTVADCVNPVPVIRAAISEPGRDYYVGDGAGYAAQLERHGLSAIAFDRQVRDTAEFLSKAALA